ncbi:hypothetical protein F5888DRAFT_1196707 [Russula emetica]|nr:hypothetical protein F5888DRAFT_1196707 [Russula emetica]
MTLQRSHRPPQDQAAQGEFKHYRWFWSLFSMYLDRAIAEDRKWSNLGKEMRKACLSLTGLFSAAVARITRNIRPKYSAQPAGHLIVLSRTLTDPIEPFVPPTSGVWVNGLWFSSLVISLTCGLLATLLQQWARRYLRVAYPHCSPYKRARIRAFYRHGVEQLHIPWTIEVLPALLHISLFLFFAGLSVFLFSVHLTIFTVVTSWIGVCAILYAILTLLPIIRKTALIPHHFFLGLSVSPAYDISSAVYVRVSHP